MSARTGEVLVDAAEKGRLDTQGRFQVASGRRNVEYRLEQVDGEWRIANPQPGLMVTARFFEDYFRPFNLYFFDRPARRLVPQPVHVLVEDGLAPPRSRRWREATSYPASAPSCRSSTTCAPPCRWTGESPTWASPRGRASQPMSSTCRRRWRGRCVRSLMSAVSASQWGRAPSPSQRRRAAVDDWDKFGVGQSEGTVRGLIDKSVVEVDGADVQPIAVAGARMRAEPPRWP